MCMYNSLVNTGSFIGDICSSGFLVCSVLISLWFINLRELFSAAAAEVHDDLERAFA